MKKLFFLDAQKFKFLAKKQQKLRKAIAFKNWISKNRLQVKKAQKTLFFRSTTLI